MRASFRIAVITLSVCLAGISAAFSQTVSKVAVTPLDKSQYIAFMTSGFDILSRQDDSFEIAAWPGDTDQLDALGIPYEVIEPDLRAFYQSRAAARTGEVTTMGGFLTFSEIETFLDDFADANPDICTQKFSIGQTVEGREQWVVKISDNPNVDENEPEVFYNSLIHAREPAGAQALLVFMQYLADNYGVDPEVTDVVDNRELFFLPVVNPDGYVYNELIAPGGGGMWRKNRKINQLNPSQVGVDLNRNFGYMWGYDDYGSSGDWDDVTFRGESAFSEIETQNLRDFVISRDFVICQNTHTYSNLVLWAWGYDRIYTDREKFFRVLGDSLTQYNGYTPTVGWGLYPTNGDADDWMWGDTISKPRLISVTTEIGTNTDGFWPSLSRIQPLANENIMPNLYLAKIADAPLLLAPPATPEIFITDTSGDNYTIEWVHEDSINPATSYTLQELSGKSRVVDDVETDQGFWDAHQMQRTTVRSFSGSYSWESLDQNSTNHTLTTAIPYEVQAGDTLRLKIWYDIETDWDYFYVEVSGDDEFTFETVPGNLTTNFNPNGNNRGNGVTGSSGGWVDADFDLTAYAGQRVRLRLNYSTDSYVLGAGVYIDDIQEVEKYDFIGDIGSDITDTSYAFTAQPPGDYYYRVIAEDAQGQLSSWSNLVRVDIAPQYIVGDCNGDQTVDISDLTALVNYLFVTFVEPASLDAANTDCAGGIDISDLTKLVNNLFVTFEPLACP